MSSNHGYSHAPTNNLLAFKDTLEEGAWASIPRLELDPERGLAPLAEASLLSAAKTQLWWSIGRLAMAVGRNPEDLKNKDNAWNSCQRRFHFALAVREEDINLAVRTDAALIRKVVFDDQTTGQTNWSYKDKISFGHSQATVVTDNAPVAQALTRLGLSNYIVEVKDHTNALQAAIRVTKAGSSSQGRHAGVRVERQLCISVMNSTHSSLERLYNHTPDGPDRDFFSQLLQPFLRLLAKTFPSDRP